MPMDVLIMPTPPPMLVGNTIRVALSATGTSDQGQSLQILFAVDYQYGTTASQKQTAILNAARQAYVDWCASRGIAPLPVNQMRVEILGV
jgi:hypothetical protein